MRRVLGGSAVAMLAMLLRAGAVRAQANDPVGVLPGWGVVRPPGQGAAEPYRMPAATTYGVLDEMASRASVMFVGRVTSVRWLGGGDAAGDAASGIVAVEFAVEEAILGPGVGSTYVMREWAGLWRDAARFRVGQRRLMLLHAPGPGGLSSPVDGLDGAIPVTGETVGAQAAPSPAALRADLRWIQAKQLRVVTFAGEPVPGPGEQPAEPLAATRSSFGSVASAPPQSPAQHGFDNAGGAGGVSPKTAPAIAENPPLADVIGRLRAGEALPHAGR